MNRRKFFICLYAAFVACVFGVVTAIFVTEWVVKSYFEARAFNRVTGKNVSTWDAMFIELRVQEPSK